MDPNGYDDAYGACEQTYASLRIAGGDEHPSTVGACLELEPTRMRVRGQAGSWRNGELRVAPSGAPSRFNLWSLCTDGAVTSRDSRRHVDHLLALLDGKDACFAELRAAGWAAEVIVYWVSKSGHGGPMLNPATMRRLSELGISIWFDVYLSESDHEPEEVEGQPG